MRFVPRAIPWKSERSNPLSLLKTRQRRPQQTQSRPSANRLYSVLLSCYHLGISLPFNCTFQVETLNRDSQTHCPTIQKATTTMTDSILIGNPSLEGPVRIGIVTDIQYADKPDKILVCHPTSFPLNAYLYQFPCHILLFLHSNTNH